jgi:hypothetical protein
MKSQQDNYQSQEEKELLVSERLIYYVLLGISLLVLLGLLLFGNTSTELTCSRSYLNSIECNLVRNTPILRMSPIKILDPLAVDVIRHRHRGTDSYSAEIRADHVSYTLSILSTYNYKLAQDTANKVNDFLLKSDAVSFAKRFPEKTG